MNDATALENHEKRIAALEEMVARTVRQRGAPSLIEHLKHVYELMPKIIDVTNYASTGKEFRSDVPEARQVAARLGEAARELRGVLISLGVPPEELTP